MVAFSAIFQFQDGCPHFAVCRSPLGENFVARDALNTSDIHRAEMEHLPGDLLQSILEDYIASDQKSALPALDVAICSHGCRGEFLAVLRRIRLPEERRSPASHSLGNYVAWIAMRGIHLPTLRVRRSAIKGLVQELVSCKLQAVLRYADFASQQTRTVLCSVRL